jgi:hypothetical protein
MVITQWVSFTIQIGFRFDLEGTRTEKRTWQYTKRETKRLPKTTKVVTAPKIGEE